MQRSTFARLTTALLAAYWLAMFVGTHTPSTPHVIDGHGDKLLHFLGYGGLAALCGIAWTSNDRAGGRLSLKQCALIVLGLAVYGALDEVTQIPVGRSCEFLDWVADVVGAGMGIVGAKLLVTAALLLLNVGERTASSS